MPNKLQPARNKKVFSIMAAFMENQTLVPRKQESIIHLSAEHNNDKIS